MNHHKKLILHVYDHPALWDRNDNQFRNTDVKTHFWDKIGQSLGHNGTYCKDAFKSLREKYVREKDKFIQRGNTCKKKWELYDMLMFLDPHIVPRKGATSSTTNEVKIKEDSNSLQFESSDYLTENINQDLIKELISLVKNTKVIWDKRHLNHGDSRMRESLWQDIGQKLNTDANICKLRWKALREKYIRQKHRKTYGDTPKWHFMNDMSFLDNVIQLRKSKLPGTYTEAETNPYTHSTTNNTDSELDEHTNDSYQQPNDYSFQRSQLQQKPTPDSTLTLVANRKRTHSSSTEVSIKKEYNEVHEVPGKTPEVIFGEFVAAVLSTKSANEKNTLMMNVMAVLTDNSERD